MHDFGAGDLLEIEPEPAAGGKRGESLLVPFTREAVPEVDLEAGRVVVVPPDAMEAAEPAEEGTTEGTSHER